MAKPSGKQDIDLREVERCYPRTKMKLESNVTIRKDAEHVWSFLEDISNVPKWDRGVAAVRWTSAGPHGLGSEFDTLPYPRRPGDDGEWGRMSYRVTELDKASRSVVIQLISTTGNARYFKAAAWLTRVDPLPEGSLVFSCVEFTLRIRYTFLAPVLYGSKHAIRTDLESLRQALESS